MRDAGAVAETFHLDPLLVLDEPDPLRRLFRIAAHNAVLTERERQQKAAQRRK